ncbi:type VI-B CRISPR accessory protein Csx27 [Bacteroides pyogenes]|uniref:type VI-B CRISPR accessory protein Csx27 n=1 Tax=Bacteroides pyogenes TaxID=310300 RepID=UPI0003DD5AB4|nr:CRISPR-associated protein Csx27 [Bacteroides pyogenes]GAE20956.1 hypothetical protein JCM10003_348 [Bacteroides pyogenes JCM 10003]SUV31595.1 Uncharacterised protein [Bacteroides pyogenes]
MNKFSLYDFLSILLPGVIFLVAIRVAQPFWRFNTGLYFPQGWEFSLVYSLVIGASLYVLGFSVKKNYSVFFRRLGLYEHVTILYHRFETLHPFMNGALNKYAEEWNGTKPYCTVEQYDAMDASAQKEIEDAQDIFYDHMYYRLDCKGKLEGAKAFQSYYLCFLHSFLGLLIFGVYLLICILLSYFMDVLLADTWQVAFLFLMNLCVMYLFMRLARWFRQRMVLKMYWAFYESLIE